MAMKLLRRIAGDWFWGRWKRSTLGLFSSSFSLFFFLLVPSLHFFFIPLCASPVFFSVRLVCVCLFLLVSVFFFVLSTLSLVLFLSFSFPFPPLSSPVFLPFRFSAVVPSPLFFFLVQLMLVRWLANASLCFFFILPLPPPFFVRLNPSSHVCLSSGYRCMLLLQKDGNGRRASWWRGITAVRRAPWLKRLHC